MGKAPRSLFTGTGVGSIFRFVRELDLESGVIDNPRRGRGAGDRARRVDTTDDTPPPRPAPAPRGSRNANLAGARAAAPRESETWSETRLRLRDS